MGMIRRGLFLVLLWSQAGLVFGADDLIPGPSLGWLAYGDLRGHLEPCGCDPKTDLGGLRRIASLLRRERGVHPGLLTFDLGGNVASPKSKESVKNRFMQEALAALSPDVRLFGAAEWQLVAQGGKAAVGLNTAAFTLSNIGTTPAKKGAEKGLLSSIAPWRKPPGAVVYGFLSPTLAKGAPLEPFSKSFLKRLQKDVVHNRVDGAKNILLFAGTDSELGLFVESKLFDEVLSANTAAAGREPGKEEPENPSLLARKPKFTAPEADAAFGGNVVWMVPLGGQGVLRGGSLRQQRAKSIEELLKVSPPKSESFEASGVSGGAKIGGSTGAPEVVTWLDPSYDGEGITDSVFVRYNAFAKEELGRLSSSRAGDLKKTTFAGAEACMNCHKAEYEIWQSSSHAKALASIKAKAKDQDPECVSCHVLGFDAKGGFVSEELSPKFAAVQCENCHGPAKAHAMNPAMVHPKPPKGKASEVCVSCHVTPHSSSFSFASYWPKVFHGKKGP